MLLLLGPIADDVVGDDIRGQRDAERRTGIGEFLVDHRIEAEIKSGTPKCLWYGRAEKACLATGGPETAVANPLSVPAHEIGDKRTLEESADQIAKQGQLFGHMGASSHLKHGDLLPVFIRVTTLDFTSIKLAKRPHRVSPLPPPLAGDGSRWVRVGAGSSEPAPTA